MELLKLRRFFCGSVYVSVTVRDKAHVCLCRTCQFHKILTQCYNIEP